MSLVGSLKMIMGKRDEQLCGAAAAKEMTDVPHLNLQSGCMFTLGVAGDS
jgi:hypothetical protein